MFSESTQTSIIFTVCLLVLGMLFAAFISNIVYRYKRNQRVYYEEVEALKDGHESRLLRSTLEMQEYTFSKVSREIHDNVGQKLSLAKLLLNTRPFDDNDKIPFQVFDTIELITESLGDLSDLSKSMTSEVLLDRGLMQAIDFEVSQLRKSRMYNAWLVFEGENVFLDTQRELSIFRIVQESFHNIIKHANASDICIRLRYDDDDIHMIIEDNGNGFQLTDKKNGTGLANIKSRTHELDGKFAILSSEMGTSLNFKIPLKQLPDA
jgi:two-component system, NarL family, sensor kinase